MVEKLPSNNTHTHESAIGNAKLKTNGSSLWLPRPHKSTAVEIIEVYKSCIWDFPHRSNPIVVSFGQMMFLLLLPRYTMAHYATYTIEMKRHVYSHSMRVTDYL